MRDLEGSLKMLVAKMTGKPEKELPNSLESLISFGAEHMSSGGSGEKGEKGDPGAKGEPGTNGTNGAKGTDGKSLTKLAFTKDVDGKITGGKATLSDNSEITITIS